MSSIELSRKLAELRGSLYRQIQAGRLIAEHILIADGEYAGHRFCFENAQVSWRFDDDSFEVETPNSDGKFAQNQVKLDLAGPEASEPIRRAA